MNDKTIKNLESLHNKILKSKLCEEITEDEMKAFVELKDIANITTRATAVTVAESNQNKE